MSLIPALVQELFEIFFGGPKRPPGWNRVRLRYLRTMLVWDLRSFEDLRQHRLRY